MRCRVVLPVAVLLFVGCAFPHWNRYAVNTRVLNDATGASIADAQAVVEVFHQRVAVPSHYDFYVTDGEGRLEIPESKDWQVTPPLPDAVSIDIQYLTIFKPGFLPYHLKGTTQEPIYLSPIEVREVQTVLEQARASGSLNGAYQLVFQEGILLTGHLLAEWDPATQSLLFTASDRPIHYGENIPVYSVRSIRDHEKVVENTILFSAPNRVVLAQAARYFPETGLIEFVKTRTYSRKRLVGSIGMSVRFNLLEGSLTAQR